MVLSAMGKRQVFVKKIICVVDIVFKMSVCILKKDDTYHNKEFKEEHIMVIPDGEFNALFLDDGRPFEEKMTEYIRKNFSDVLGSDTMLLDTPNGLDTLASKYSVSSEADASKASETKTA